MRCGKCRCDLRQQANGINDEGKHSIVWVCANPRCSGYRRPVVQILEDMPEEGQPQPNEV